MGLIVVDSANYIFNLEKEYNYDKIFLKFLNKLKKVSNTLKATVLITCNVHDAFRQDHLKGIAKPIFNHCLSKVCD